MPLTLSGLEPRLGIRTMSGSSSRCPVELKTVTGRRLTAPTSTQLWLEVTARSPATLAGRAPVGIAQSMRYGRCRYPYGQTGQAAAVTVVLVLPPTWLRPPKDAQVRPATSHQLRSIHMSGFTAYDVPDQQGRTALVTGANTGLGFWTAVHLAKAGARVLIGSRSAAKGADALRSLRDEAPGSEADVLQLDLSSLAAVEDAAGRLRASENQLDLLINNAGVMMPPYGTTADGFELQLGVNHLGHFALTAHLLPLLATAPAARVVSVSSLAHRDAGVFFDDLQAEQSYSADARYGQSKLANLLFTFELDRRLRAAGSSVRALAAHPGIARTELTRHFPGPVRLLAPLIGLILNSAEQGSWPSLMAATSPDVEGGDYVGPTRFREMSGPAGPAASSSTANDQQLQRRFWDLSVELTGIDPLAALA